MTIQTIATNFMNTADMPMNIEYHDWYKYKDTKSNVEHRSTQMTPLAIATIPEDYLRIECTVIPWDEKQNKYVIRVYLPDECSYAITSPEISLIEFLYKRILNNQDTWASDIREALPEICI